MMGDPMSDKALGIGMSKAQRAAQREQIILFELKEGTPERAIQHICQKAGHINPDRKTIRKIRIEAGLAANPKHPTNGQTVSTSEQVIADSSSAVVNAAVRGVSPLASAFDGMNGAQREALRQSLGASPTITGQTPADMVPDGAGMVKRLVSEQAHHEAKIEARNNQCVELQEDGPCVVALLSDMHMGNTLTNYRAFFEDVDTIAATPGCYAVSTGDIHEMWLGKLAMLNGLQKMDIPGELALCREFFERLGGKLVAAVAGNHDTRPELVAGIDIIREMLHGAVMLYDHYEVGFTLSVAGAEHRVLLRHKWRHSSELNPYHGAMKYVRFVQPWHDILVSGHDHIGTMFADFLHDGKHRLICKVGTYKMDDSFGRQCGFPASVGTGSGAILFVPNEPPQGFRSLTMAVKVLKAMQGDG